MKINLNKAREWAKCNKWFTLVIAFAIIELVLLSFAAYNAYVTNEENKSLSYVLDDAWRTADTLRKEKEQLQVHSDFLELDSNLWFHSYLEKKEENKQLLEEKEELEKENAQLQEDMEEKEEQYRDCRNRLESLDKDYAGTLKKSAHFTITGKAVVKNELTDEEEEIAINEHLLAIPEKNTLPAEFPLLWNSEVINLQLEVTSPEGEVRLNYETNTSITKTGAYVVSVLGKDGNYEATVVVGKDQREYDLTPKMHVPIR